MSAIADAYEHLQEAFDLFRRAAEDLSTSDAELLSVLTLKEGMCRQYDHLAVATTASLQRRGAFVARGYRDTAGALTDLLGCDRYEAHRQVLAAEQVCEQVGIDGTVMPARLPATGKAFAAGQASLRHVEVIVALLGSPEAGRITEGQRVGLEEQLAGLAGDYAPGQVRKLGTELLEALDDDGPEPDDTPPAPVNRLQVRRHRNRPGGTISGQFDDAAMFDAIASVIDAKAKPLGRDDQRPTGQRQAEALADACGYVLAHGDHGVLPETGGRRPHLNVLIRLEDLEGRARSAVLDLGGRMTPESLRMLACDAGVVPIVMNGAGQPLDVGRSTRVIPDGLRRAVAARDRGCAHPGCDRLPSWSEIHHIREWEHGGPTELGNLVMVCKVHHRLIHHSEWSVRIRDGLPEFIPPKWIDPRQRPRRNR
jgi:hypothetical protein